MFRSQGFGLQGLNASASGFRGTAGTSSGSSSGPSKIVSDMIAGKSSFAVLLPKVLMSTLSSAFDHDPSLNYEVVPIMHLGCRDTGVLNAFGLCPTNNLRVSWVTHPDFESFSALTGVGGTELIAASRSRSWCSTLPPASPSPSDAAPASPEGRLVTESPAPETVWPVQERN